MAPVINPSHFRSENVETQSKNDCNVESQTQEPIPGYSAASNEDKAAVDQLVADLQNARNNHESISPSGGYPNGGTLIF